MQTIQLSEEPRQKKGRLLVDSKLVEAPPPSKYIAGRTMAALLFRFFSGFKCGVLLFIVLPDVY